MKAMASLHNGELLKCEGDTQLPKLILKTCKCYYNFPTFFLDSLLEHIRVEFG